MTAKTVRKALTALAVGLVGVITTAITQGLIEGTAAKWAAIVSAAVVTVAATYGVYIVPNQPPRQVKPAKPARPVTPRATPATPIPPPPVDPPVP